MDSCKKTDVKKRVSRKLNDFIVQQYLLQKIKYNMILSKFLHRQFLIKLLLIEL